MPFTDAPGFRMRYEVSGTGFPLLLINGLGSDHTEWLFQLPAFAIRHRVVCFDNRGAGDSEAPPGPYSTERMGDDAAALLSFLRIGRAHVLGVSLGGMIAQQLALRHPGRVARLVLACTTPGGGLSVRPSEEALAAFARREGEPPEEELTRMIPYLYSERYRQEHPQEIEAFVRRRLARPAPLEGYRAQLAAAVGHGAGERLRDVRASTLVITGDADRLVPAENSEILARLIPGARLAIVPGGPHRLFAENAGRFNREVLAFLGEEAG